MNKKIFLINFIFKSVKESLRYVFNINPEVFAEKLPLIRKTEVDRSFIVKRISDLNTNKRHEEL